ncbi:MAG TPA: hypothetical protein VN926_11340 [Bradyrhizobium sp.]|nr:hypothetical protein [Bradyrhizobium sp.]
MPDVIRVCAWRERGCDRRATEKRDESATLHPKTLLLAARNGASRPQDITAKAKATTAIAAIRP